MAIEIKKQGRRYYIVGDTIRFKTWLKQNGFRWDPKERGWWTGKADLAERAIEDAKIERITWAKVGDTWCVRVRSLRGEAPGKWIEVESRSGRCYRVRLGARLEDSPEGYAIFATDNPPADTYVSSEDLADKKDTTRLGGRCRGCGGEIKHAAHHRAMNGYCGSCAFDEFDC